MEQIALFNECLNTILGQAVTVGVTMYVLSISELSEVQMVSWLSYNNDVLHVNVSN